MNNKYLNLIDENTKSSIYKKIEPKIKDKVSGVLYTAIESTICSLELDKPQEKLKEICEYFDIHESTFIEDDFGIAYDNVGLFFLDVLTKCFSNHFPGPIPKFEKPAFTHTCSNLSTEQKMEIILVTAFILISGLAFVKRKSLSSNANSSTLGGQQDSLQISPAQPIPVSICLAVPASSIASLNIDESINHETIIQLIDMSSDYLCVDAKNYPLIDIDKSQTPSPDSQLKFYIRINIQDGGNIIDAKTKYVIKRDLLHNIQGKVKELGRLKSVDSISLFNRI